MLEQTIVKACLLAGRIMMQSGAETYRVEDTMVRMANACGISESQSFVTPTGIIFSLDGLSPTHLVRINERGTDLEKIAEVNRISRMIASKEINAVEALEQLQSIERAHLGFPIPLQIVAAAFASGSFSIMFHGGWADFLPAFFVGGLGFLILLFIHHITKVKLFAEFLAASTIGTAAMLLLNIRQGMDLDLIIIASVMPLVPGLLITNAIRDLMAGNFVSGLSKGAEAFLTAFAIGSGVAVVFLIGGVS
ncbi:threonine/serine exporter family protein [Bacillus sp. FJAT-50079]|uniref:threonine/serine exporter family protein n=1 Tax=Bacillus sp. FJAT-50079 TaxID=2833577 RepID=UPI001BC96C76|nr:threonine/serine exporter family protein [Bacillus sp. FJAT-50079]MBS4210311.1 threonine/serine exporter family protein [Bacillus sp. FJAT-50079]